MRVPPIAFSSAERIAMGSRCSDCDSIPKVADAGKTMFDADGQHIQLMHNGLRVVANGYCGEWMTDLIRICNGHHEPQEERLFHEVVERLPIDATMIELGGYWSYYSLWFLKDRPARRAIVIEPDPTHLAIGVANAKLNRLSPKFKHGFVGAIQAKKSSFLSETSGELQLPCFSVEGLFKEGGWEKVSLLHCDIQGCETEILDSCRAFFMSGKIDWIFVSTHSLLADELTFCAGQ